MLLLLLLKESRVQVGLSSTLYPGVDVAVGVLLACRGVPSLAGVVVRSLALCLCPGPAPSWLSTSEVLPEELSWRREEKEKGGMKRQGCGEGRVVVVRVIDDHPKG